jgi:hypothetical protein
MQNFNKLLLSISLLLVSVFLFSDSAYSQVHNYVDLPLSGSQEVDPNASTATGTLNGTYDESTMMLAFTVEFSDLTDTTTAAHFHGPALPGAGAGVRIGWTDFPTGVTSGTFSDTLTLDETQEAELLAGLWYANIHTAAYLGGEIRGQMYEANGIHYYTNLEMSGSNEVPSNPSTATGNFTGRYYEGIMMFVFTVDFEGLSDTTTAAHFHGPATPDTTAGVAIGWTGFPTGVTSGTFTDTVTLDETQEADLLAGLWYANIHSAMYPGGELRVQLDETVVPVELTSFTAFVTGKAVTLNWSTATEINNSGFEIQRSTNNKNWNAAAFIEGKGTTTSPADYNYVDNSITSGKYFYRLKQIDFDGSSEYSNTVEVYVGIPDGFVLEQNYPNPFNPSTKIKFGFDQNTKAELKIFDVLGNEVVKLFNETAEAGRIYEVNFNASALASGVYYYRLSGDNRTEIKKMMLLK